jgi:hypothetical protein
VAIDTSGQDGTIPQSGHGPPVDVRIRGPEVDWDLLRRLADDPEASYEGTPKGLV